MLEGKLRRAGIKQQPSAFNLQRSSAVVITLIYLFYYMNVTKKISFNLNVLIFLISTAVARLA